MSEAPGIDMEQSGWQPATAPPPPRPNVPAPPVKQACEAPGPGGFVCDRDAGHPGDNHWADDASQGGLSWAVAMHETTAFGDTEPSFIPGRMVTMEMIAEKAEKAMESPSPAQWAVALAEIARLCRG